MPLEMETSEDLSTGSFLKEPGTYHLIVVDSEEQATDKDGNPLDAFKLSCGVCAGTVPSQENKTVDITIFHPTPSDRNGSEDERKRYGRAMKKRTRTLIALSKMRPADAGKPASVDLRPEATIGAQFIATLDKNSSGFLRLHYEDIYHVDDPEAKAFPKSAKLLAMIPAEQRLTAKDFGAEDASPNAPAAPLSNGNGSQQQAAKKPAINLDDL